MKRARGFLLVMLTACLASGVSAAPRSLAGDKQATQDVKHFYERWIQAFEKRDLAALMSCYDKGVVFSMQGQPNANLAGIRAGFEADFKAFAKGATWLPKIEQVYADGALIVVIARWEYLDKGQSGKIESLYRIRSVDVLTPSADGLKILHTVNYPLDPPAGR